MPAARQWRIKSAALAARLFLHQDVSFEESWPGVIDATERRFGRLDVMVVNAGIGILCGAIEMSLADWRRQTAVNLHGVFLSVKYAVPAMRRAGNGSIIIMSSRRRPRRLARGIRINTVHPGVIDTPIWTKIPASTGSNAPIDPQRGGQSRAATRQGWPSARYCERRTVSRLRHVELHDRCGDSDRRRYDGGARPRWS